MLTVASYQDRAWTSPVATPLSARRPPLPSVRPAAGADTFIDLTAPKVREITLNGSPVGPDAFNGDRITLTGLAEANELSVVADCAYSRTGEGLHRFTDPVDGGVYLYSDLETFDAHRIYACFDQPDLKAPVRAHGDLPRETGRWCPTWPRTPPRRPATRHRALALPADAADVDLHHGVAAGPYHVVRLRPRRHPAGHLLPPVAGQLPRSR